MAHQYRFDDIVIDHQSFRLLRAGKPLAVEPKSLHVLIFLVRNKGRLIERRELLAAVWGDAFVTDHVLNRAIGQLRKTLQDDPKQPRYIETVPTLGYRFIAEVEIFEDAASVPPLPFVANSPELPQTEAQKGVQPVAVALPEPSARSPRPRSTFIIVSAGLVLIALGIAFGVFIRNHIASRTRSLAVLPLKNISGDPTQDYLADGMTEELITDLGQIGALRVISPTTAMQYKNPHKALPQIAQELHVDAVVEGSITRSGDRLRIDAQLTDARADKQTWARSFEGDLHDAFALQNQVAAAVANEIRIQMTTQEKTELSSSQQTNPLAYQALLKGYYFENVNTPDSFRKSQQYFKQAADRDPHFARAYVGIARSYNFLADADAIAPGEATAAADAALAKALELDPNLGEAYAERGWMELFYHWDLPDAGRDFRHAIDLNPGDASFHQGLAHYLVRIGKFDDGFQEFERASNLDPLSLRNKSDYCMMLMFAKRYDEAIRQCREALEMDPNYDLAVSTLSDIYARTGRYAQANELLRKTLWCAVPECQRMFDEVHGAPGTAGAADVWIKTHPREVDSLYLAIIYTGLGKKDLAFANMEKAYEKHRGMQTMTFWSIDPYFAPLYSDPRFDAFLKRVGLPPRPTPQTAKSD